NCPWDPPHFPPKKAHHQDHVWPGDGLRQRKEIGKFPIRHPSMHEDDKGPDIGKYTGKATKADRRQQGEMRGKCNGGSKATHCMLFSSIAVMTMLSRVVPRRTTSSGSCVNAMPAKAHTAMISADGRWR